MIYPFYFRQDFSSLYWQFCSIFDDFHSSKINGLFDMTDLLRREGGTGDFGLKDF